MKGRTQWTQLRPGDKVPGTRQERKSVRPFPLRSRLRTLRSGQSQTACRGCQEGSRWKREKAQLGGCLAPSGGTPAENVLWNIKF